MIGSHNNFDDNARYIVGGGSPGERRTIMKVAFDGTIQSGDGSNVRTTVNGVSHVMTYTDAQGNEQPVAMSDPVQRTPGSGPVIDC